MHKLADLSAHRSATLLLLAMLAACESTSKRSAGLGEACQASADCPNALMCFGDVPGGECSTPCQRNSDCGDDAACADGRCRPRCASAADCARRPADCQGAPAGTCQPAAFSSDAASPPDFAADSTTADLVPAGDAQRDLLRADGPSVTDLAAADSAVAVDLAALVDFARPRDLAAADLAAADLAAADLAAADLAAADLAAADLALGADFAAPGDLATPTDRTVAGDLASARDLSPLPDFAASPDLAPLGACDDKLRNGDESDVDCGGRCPKCALGATCLQANDCQSANCANGVCKLSAGCIDGVRNGNETDLDCGGDRCLKCGDGKQCILSGDCVNNLCQNGRCAPLPRCDDGTKNGSETDVDCGGSCAKCGDGKTCARASDCVSGQCANLRCAAKGLLLNFAPGQQVATGVQPIIADFNGDGRSDLAALSVRVNVQLGRGDGTFQAPAASLGVTPAAFTAGDFNGDKRIDIAAVERNNPAIAFYAGQGDGTFMAAKNSVWGGAAVPTLAATDLNGDGRADLLGSYFIGGLTQLFAALGDGMGGFQISIDLPIPAQPLVPAVGDFNRDGRTDVAIATSGGLHIYLNSGVWNIVNRGLALSATLPAPIAGVYGVVASDFDADGKLDLATNHAPQGPLLYRGIGDGTFAAALVGNLQFGNDLGAADFNNDGNLDLATTVSGVAGVAVLAGKGDGTFQSAVNFPYKVRVNMAQPFAADLNGDNRRDLLFMVDGGIIALLNTSQ